MKSLYKEFKEFAIKGNMIDIAIGVIIGAAFNKVVDVLVKEVLLPPLSYLTDGNNWENKKLILREALVVNGGKNLDEIAIGYGKLMGASMDFIIIGLTVFIIVKVMNTLRNKAQDPKNKTTTTPKDIELLHQISELLEQQLEISKKTQSKK